MQLVPLGGGAGERLNHVGSPTRMAEILRTTCGAEVDDAIVQARIRLWQALSQGVGVVSCYPGGC